jgi:hypothetical protein
MKIVRVTFSLAAAHRKYFMDRPYDEQKNDQENCDAALNYLVDAVKHEEALAIMREHQQKLLPVLINFKNVVEINVLNVAVYKVKPEDDSAK